MSHPGNHATRAAAFDPTCPSCCWLAADIGSTLNPDPLRPLDTDEEPWSLEARCPGCKATLFGIGTLEHNADGSHTWTPADEPGHITPVGGWLLICGLILVVVAAIAWRLSRG